MVKYLEHRQLIAKGLACGKIRRRLGGRRTLPLLEKGWSIRFALLFLLLLAFGSLSFFGEDHASYHSYFIALSLFFTALAGLWLSHSEVLSSNSRLILMFGAVLVQLVFIKIMLFAMDAGSMDPHFASLLLPYTLAPFVLSVLLGNEAALFGLFLGSLWGAFLWNHFQDVNIPFLLFSLLTGLVAIFSTQQVRRRSRLLRAGVYVGLATLLLAILLGNIDVTSLPLTKRDILLILVQCLGTIANGIILAVVVSGCLPILEYLFSVTTEISWLEMTDLNHPLLRRLSLEAPGTYQHSIAVATLAEAAAEVVHANATLCRVGAYFHDIGKLVKPEYFTENISTEESPHHALTPTMSALILIAHVKEGVDLALKNKLHPRIVDIISQHHGTTMVGQFFERARLQQEDVRRGVKMLNLREEDIPEVEEQNFRYPGPKLQTKEAVIVSLADLAESITHSMEKPSRQRINDLMQDVLKERLQEGEYNQSPLTVGELHKIVETLVNTLSGMMHTRIAYRKS